MWRETFDMAPLPLGVGRVEQERTLARTRHARDYDEAIERDREGEVLEAMLD